MKILTIILSLFLFSCGNKLNAIKRQLNKITLASNSDRLTLYTNSVAMIRSTQASTNTKSTLPYLKNIASVSAPTSTSSTGDVQATSVIIKDNYAYISYNMVGEEVFGAIDIIDISKPESPSIAATFTSSDAEFSDLKIYNNTLYLIGYQKETKDQKASAVLLIFDITSKIDPILKNTILLPGTYAISVDIKDHQLLVATGSIGGNYLYDLTDPYNPSLLESKEQANVLYSKFGFDTVYQLSGDSSTIITDVANKETKVISNNPSIAPSRFTIQNSLLYTNNTQSKKLHILDLSNHLQELSTLDIEGTANGLAQDQQRLYLASGEKGFVAIDISNPTNPTTIGSLYFEGENGSANNIWIQTTSNGKFYFLADGRQGLRILKENISTPTPQSTISFFARGNNFSSELAPVLDLKINHTIIHKFTINNNDFKIFNYELDQTISSSDKVEFVFNNWTASKQIILPFVKINDRYCYIKTTATSDFGLITQYQSLGFLNNDCVNNILTYQCDPGATKSCVTDHLQGISTCSDSGLWSSCISTNQCETGYALSADSCLAQICTPNDTAACLSDNGSGTKKCNDTGLSYGTCQLSKCNAGFSLQNNTCVAQICSPNTITSCVINHKNGSKTCDSKGLLISDCIPTSPISCENNYYSLNNECLSQMCIPNATTTCQVSNGIGVKTCNNQGSAFGSCTATTCNSGYTLENGSCAIQVCTPNTSISCISNHLIGSQTCNASGTSYNSCTLSTNCESGFFYSNGTCTPQICEPGSSMGCVSNHLLGTKSCNQQGSSFSSCQLTTTCDSGYTFTNNTCQPMISSPSFFVLAGSSIKLSVEFTATGLVVSNSLSDNSLDLSSTVTNAKQQLSVDLKQLVYSPLLADHGKQTITLKAILDGGIVSIPVTINVMTPFTWTGSSSNVLDQNAKNNFCGSVTADNLACTGLPSLNYHTSENLLYTLKPGYNLAGNVSNDNAFYSFILDNTCSTNCNVNLQTHLYTKGLWLREYSFTQNQYNITYSGSGVILENQATFNGGSGSLSTPLNCDTESLGTNTSYYDFSCTNSIFNSPKTLRIGGNFTVNTTCTYNHFYTDDTLRFVSNVDSGSCNNWQKRSNISVPSSFTVNNLEFTGDNPTYDLLNSTITVAGNLLFEDKNLTASNRGSLLNGTIDTKGNVLLMDVRSVGNLLVKMTGSNNQTISCPIVNITHGFDTSSRAINDYYCMIPQLEINKTGGVLTGSDFLRFHNKFNYIAGSVDFSKAIGMFGDLVPSTSAYSITSSWNIPTTTTIVPTNVSVAPIITSEWYNGYNYQITITNNTGSQISDWKLCFDYNHKAPSSIWNAVYDSKTTSPNWVLNPQSYNHIIYPGSNVTLGWQGSYSISGDKISNLHLLINNDVSQDCSSQTSSFFKILYTTTNIPPNSIWY